MYQDPHPLTVLWPIRLGVEHVVVAVVVLARIIPQHIERLHITKRVCHSKGARSPTKTSGLIHA